MGALALLVAALAVSSAVGAATARAPEPDQGGRPAATALPDADRDRRDVAPAGCGRDTVACELSVPAPGCEPRVGALCSEAFADAALMRWIHEHRPMPPGHAVLDVVDGRWLVVGYAHGFGEPDVEVDVVERDDHVSITLRFDLHQEPSLDGADVSPPVIGYGRVLRVLVELAEPLGGRVVDVWPSYTPNERPACCSPTQGTSRVEPPVATG